MSNVDNNIVVKDGIFKGNKWDTVLLCKTPSEPRKIIDISQEFRRYSSDLIPSLLTAKDHANLLAVSSGRISIFLPFSSHVPEICDSANFLHAHGSQIKKSATS